MKLNALSGCVLRKAFNATRVRMVYHNKHKDGSGNFGFLIVFEKGGVKDVGCGMTAPNETWYDMHGMYTAFKEVYALHFGTYISGGARLPDDWTFQQIVNFCKRIIIDLEGTNKPEKVTFT